MKKGLDNIDELPYRQSLKEIRGWGSWDKNDRKKIDDISPYRYVKRVLEKFKGKQVDKAFSFYCTKIDFTQQEHWFWDEFQDAINTKRRRGDDYDFSYWYIDKNNNIQYHKEKKDEVIWRVKSADYEEGYINHMGEVITEEEFTRTVGRHQHWEGRWQRAQYSKWTRVIIQGCVYSFKKKDASFYRHLADENGKNNKQRREYAKYVEERAYSFLTREEEQRIKDKDEDIRKRDSHGFNEDSFTNNNGRLDEN